MNIESPSIWVYALLLFGTVLLQAGYAAAVRTHLSAGHDHHPNLDLVARILRVASVRIRRLS